MFYPVIMKQERPIVDSPLLEVAEILALGILRLRAGRPGFLDHERQISLDFYGPSEPSWVNLENEGKSHE